MYSGFIEEVVICEFVVDEVRVLVECVGVEVLCAVLEELFELYEIDVVIVLVFVLLVSGEFLFVDVVVCIYFDVLSDCVV